MRIPALTNLSRTISRTEENHQWRTAAYLVLCAVALLSPSIANAAGWEIDPVRIELSPQQQTAALTVKNSSDQATSIQIQAVAWSQRYGKDVYLPTNELLVSPPIFTIAPKGEQIIRVALRRQADATHELSYRLNLQELPPPSTPNFMGVKVALRVSLPVFVQSLQGGVAPKMVWDIARMAEDQLKVVVRNSGNAHVQISDFALYVPGNDKPITGESGSSYVLAGQMQEWLLKTNSIEKIISNRLHFIAYTDANNIDTEIVLHKP
jgi:fimbrial chaperone protein